MTNYGLSIPKKISFVYNKKPLELKINENWEKVFNSFPIDAENKNSLATAQNWASEYQNKNVGIDTFDNTTLLKIQVTDIHARQNRGVAVKTIIHLNNNKYYVDLREDVFMESLLKFGVQPDGFLNDKFIFIKNKSQMKLIRYDSELHKEALMSEPKRDLKPIKNKDLEIGGVYKSKSNMHAIFLGFVDSTEFKTINTDKKDYAGSPKVEILKFNKFAIKNNMLFLTSYYLDEKDLIKEFKNIKYDNGILDYNFELKKSHSYIEKVGKCKVDSEKLISGIRSGAVIQTIDILKDLFSKNQKEFDILSAARTDQIARDSKYLNIRVSGQNIPDFNIDKFINLKAFI